MLTDRGKKSQNSTVRNFALIHFQISSSLTDHCKYFNFEGTEFLHKVADSLVSFMNLNDIPTLRITFQIINKLFLKLSNDGSAFIEFLWERAVSGALQVRFLYICAKSYSGKNI